MENTYFKVGQDVFDVRFGEGKVVKESGVDGRFPIVVIFGNATPSHSYTKDGKYNTEDKYPCLFQTKPITTPNVPIIGFEQGEMVWVLNKYNMWFPTFYSRFYHGTHLVYEMQTNGGTEMIAKEVRKFNDNPLLNHE